MWLIHLSPQSFNWVFFAPPQATSPISINQYLYQPQASRYDFGKGRVGKRHLVEFTLYNQGEVPATARFELTAKSSFSLSCPRRTTLDPKAQGQHGSTQDVSREPSDFHNALRRLNEFEWELVIFDHYFGRWWIGGCCSSFAVEKYVLGVALGGYLLNSLPWTRDNWMRSFGHPCQCICCFVQKLCVNDICFC